MLRSKQAVDKHVTNLLARVRDERERNNKGYQIAKLYVDAGEYEIAKRYLARFLGTPENDKFAAGHRLLGQILENVGQSDQAVTAYRRSFELDERQLEVLLKICELYCKVEIDPERAKYWVERAERHYPNNDVIFTLKERIVKGSTGGEGDGDDLESLIAGELVKRPEDANLRAKLLRVYLSSGRVNEAYEHGLEVEHRQAYPDNLVWYQAFADVLTAHRDAGGNGHPQFHEHLVLCLSALVRLSLREGKVADCAEALHQLDQSLKTAAKMAENSPIVAEVKAQFYLHAATLILKRGQQDQLAWREATTMAAGCYALSSALPPFSLQLPCVIKATDEEQPSLMRLHNESCVRALVAGHMLRGLVMGDSTAWCNKLNYFMGGGREKVYDCLFTLRQMKGCKDSSFLMSDPHFTAAQAAIPSENVLKPYEQAASALHGGWLAWLVWLCLQHYAARDASQPDHGLEVFPSLPYTARDLDQASPDTLSQLDAQIFLLASVRCAAVQAVNPARVAPALPPDLADASVTKEQSEWWQSVTAINSNSARSEPGKLRMRVQRGVEVVRLLGSHGLKPALLLHIARCLEERAEAARAGSEQLGSGEAADLGARAAQYWRATVTALTKLKQNQGVASPKTVMFPHDLALSDSEVEKGISEGQFFLACDAWQAGDRDQALALLTDIDTADAAYKSAQIYRELADSEQWPETDADDDTPSAYVGLLERTRDALYLAMDRIRGNRHHRLTPLVATEIDDIESRLQAVGGGLTGLTDSQSADDSRAASLSTSRLTSAHVASPSAFTTATSLAAPHLATSTPTKPAWTNPTPLRLRSVAPSPERLDVQLRSMQYSQEVLLKQALEKNEDLASQYIAIRADLEELKGLKPLILKLEALEINDDVTAQFAAIRADLEELKAIKPLVLRLQEKLESLETVGVLAAAATSVADAPSGETDKLPSASSGFASGTASTAPSTPSHPGVLAAPRPDGLYPHPPHLPPHLPGLPACYGYPPPPPDYDYNYYAHMYHPPFASPQYAAAMHQAMYKPGMLPPPPPRGPAPPAQPVHAQDVEDEDEYYDDYEDDYDSSHDPAKQSPAAGVAALGDWMYGGVGSQPHEKGYVPPGSDPAPTPAPPVSQPATPQAGFFSPTAAGPPAPGPGFFSSLNPPRFPAPVTAAATPVMTAPKPGFFSMTSPARPPATPSAASTSPSSLTGPTLFKAVPGTPLAAGASAPTASISLSTATTPPATSFPISFNSLPAASAAAGKPGSGNKSPTTPKGAIYTTSPRKLSECEAEEGPYKDDSYQGPDFEPIIPLPDEVEVKTGEEEERVLFAERAKLYRFFEKQWKERGLGEIKILLNETSGMARVVMRREQVLKVCANHLIKPDMQVEFKNHPDMRIVTYKAMDFTEDEPTIEQFCIRFKTSEIGQDYKEQFEEAQRLSATIQEVLSMVEAADAGEKAPSPPARNSLAKFAAAVGSWSCDGCYVVNNHDDATCTACSNRRPSSSKSPSIGKSVSFGSVTVGSSSEPEFSLADQFRPPAGSWDCGGCYVTNKEGDTTCVACATVRPSCEAKTNVSAPAGGFAFAPSGSVPSSAFSRPAAPLAGFTFGAITTTSDTKSVFGNVNVTPMPTPAFGNVDVKPMPTSAFGSVTPKTEATSSSGEIDVATSSTLAPIFGSAAPTSALFGNMTSTPKTENGVFGGAPAPSAAFAFSSTDGVGAVFGNTATPAAATSAFCATDFGSSVKEEAAEIPSSTADGKSLFGGFTFTSTPVIAPEKEQEVAKPAPIKPEVKFEAAKASPFSGFSFGANSSPAAFSFGEKKPDTAADASVQSGAAAAQTPTFACAASGMASFASLSSNTAGSPIFGKGTESGQGFKGSGMPVFGTGVLTPKGIGSLKDTSPPKESFMTPKETWGTPKVAPTPKETWTTPNETPKAAGGDDDTVEEFEPNAEFTPVVPLPELVEVKTGEEEEEVLFCERAKLYRYDDVEQQWKERGLGDIKILTHDGRTFRIVMRRQQVLKLCANHYITGDMRMARMASSDKAYTWLAHDWADDKGELEKLAARFKTEALAENFRYVFEDCQTQLQSLEVVTGVTPPATPPSDAAPSVGWGSQFAPSEGSWECSGCYVYNYSDIIKCPACGTSKPGATAEEEQAAIGADAVQPSDSSAFTFGAMGSSIFGQPTTEVTDKKPFTFGNISTSMKNVFGGVSSVDSVFGNVYAPSAASNAATASNASAPIFGPPKSAGDAPPKNTGFSFSGLKLGLNLVPPSTPPPTANSLAGFTFSMTPPTAAAPSDVKSPVSPTSPQYYPEEDDSHIHFEPIVSLPKVEVRTGEEDEELLYQHRAKLFRFDDAQWKERGLGDIKLLRTPGAGKVRLLMRREQILKICLNHSLAPEMMLQPMPNSDGKAWTWFAEDFSEGEGKHEKFAIKFRSAQIADEFQEALLNAQNGTAEAIEKPDPADKTPKKGASPQKETFSFSTSTSTPSVFGSPDGSKPVFGCASGFSMSSVCSSSTPVTTAPSVISTTAAGAPHSPAAAGASPLTASPAAGGASPLTRGRSLLATLLLEPQAPSASVEEMTSCGVEKMTSSGVEEMTSSGVEEMTSSGVEEMTSGRVDEVPSQDDDDVLFVAEVLPSLEKVELAEKYMLPRSFYMYETAEPCPGCIGCDEDANLSEPFTVSTADVKTENGDDNEEEEGETSEGPETVMPDASSGPLMFGGNVSSDASFAALAASDGTGFTGARPSDQPFSWSGAGATLFGQGDGDASEVVDGYESVVLSDDVHFEPIVSLPEVEVKSGEEGEEVLFASRSKLFRFEGEQWKERGIGEIKLLLHATSGKIRVLMRREQVYKLCLNHLISPDMALKPMMSSEQAWCWFAVDYSESTEGKAEQFAIKFKNKDLALDFRREFESCQATIAELNASRASQACGEAAAATDDGGDSGTEHEEEGWEDAEEEEEEPWFEKRCQISYMADDGKSWTMVGTGELRITHDDDVGGARITMTQDGDDGVMLANHVICSEHRVMCHEKKCVCEWSARDFSASEGVKRAFRVKFASKSAMFEFRDTFSDGRQLALDSDICEVREQGGEMLVPQAVGVAEQ